MHHTQAWGVCLCRSDCLCFKSRRLGAQPNPDRHNQPTSHGGRCFAFSLQIIRCRRCKEGALASVQGFKQGIHTMASNHGGKGVMDAGSSDGNNSGTTVEIKIKTLDSQTYTMRVDKCVPVPALKEQIATVTGVLSDQQRLICRGKVLKDDQLLSAYHVEDGHTLHLVARQSINPSLASFPDLTESDPASNMWHPMGSQHGPSVMVGTFNISEQGDGNLPDFSRMFSVVLGSSGQANAGSNVEAVDLQQPISTRREAEDSQQHTSGRTERVIRRHHHHNHYIPEGLLRIPGLNQMRIPGQQPDDVSARSQPNLQNASFSLPTDDSLESLQLPVIPDSLTTLSQYLRRLRQEFNENVRIQMNIGGEESSAAPHSAAGQSGLPTPAALSEVTQSTRQLLVEQAGECLTQLTRQLGDQTNVTDPVARLRMQSNALRSGALLQNLGAFLLELGRTTMTLRLGQSPTEAVVNAGPAVFISTSGPNPIMVQPLPFQPGTSFGTTPTGPGTGLRPRNIDIRIRTGSVLAPAANQREASGGERSAASDTGVSNNQAAARNLSQPTGGSGSDVRVVPIRISTLPPGLAPSEASIGSMSVLYPMVARNGVNGQVSNGSHAHNGENRPRVVPNSTAPVQPPEVPGTTHSGQTFSTEVPSGLDQLLRNLFPVPGVEDFILQGTSVETAHTPVNSQETPAVSDEGTFLSNLLHQIMPVVTQHLNGGPDGENRTTQPSSNVEENRDRGASSRQPDGPSSPPSSKRQKTE
ncbi:putative Ubiquitin-like domain-containing protein [Helianthus annuus]|nr:putative Ubiquitin-like domain-containing protein [Helianthus annuus]